MIEASPIRVALYARVSSEKQERENTIASQVAQLREAAAKASYTVVDLYEDNGYSGELLARPALDRLRDDAQQKLFDRILIHSPDRLARKFVYQEIVMDDFRRQGIEVEFLNRKIAENPEDRLLLGVQGLFSEYEKAKIKERNRRGKLHKAGKGLVVGTRAPYGYTYTKGSGRYEVDDAAAAVVRMIFDWVGNRGYSLRRVVRELTVRDVPKPTAYGFQKGWARSTVGRVIINETYIGTSFYNKLASVEAVTKRSKRVQRMVRMSRKLRPRSQWIPIPVTPIIDNELFARAQAMVKRNRVLTNGRCKNTYVLRGLFECGVCGSPMVGDPGKGRPVYRCGNREKRFPAPRLCRAPQVQAGKVEATVWGALRRALADPEVLFSNQAKIQEVMEKRNAGHDAEASGIAQERAKLEREEARLLEGYASEAITLDQMKGQMERVRARRKILEDRARGVAPRSAGIDPKDLEAMRAALLRGLEAAEGDPAKRQELLRLLVERIKMEPGRVRIIGALSGTFDGRDTGHNLLRMWPVTGVPAATFRFELIEDLAA